MIKYIVFLLLLGSTNLLFAQQEVSLPLMQDIPNSNQFNPAFTTGYKFSLALPSISNGLSSDGPTINDMFTDDGNGHYSLHLNKVIDNLREHNQLSNITKVEALGLTFEGEKIAINFSLGTRLILGLDFPKDLGKLAAYGNGPYVGETLSVGPSLDVQAYSEMRLGFSKQFGKLRAGVAGKLLYGVASAKTQKSKMELYTDPEYYQLTATSDYQIQSSSFISLDSDGQLDLETITVQPNLVLGNKGMAFDFGLVYDVSDKLSISASAVDLGSINWTDNAKLLTSNGTYEYDGVSVSGLGEIDTTSIEGVLDSVTTIFEFKSTEKDFSTPLMKKYMLGASYQFSPKTTLSGMVNVSSLNDKMHPAFALSARTYVAKWVAFGGVLSYSNQEIDHLGLNMTLKLGPVQFYLMSDNALSYLMPKSANDLHIRTGLNLVFGKSKSKKKALIIED